MFFKAIYKLRPQEVLAELDSSPQGLTTEEVIKRQSLYGKNQLTLQKNTALWKQFLTQVTHPLAILLWIAGGLAFIDRQWLLGGTIWVLVLINAWFSFYREKRAEQAMNSLQNFIPNYARVIRNGQEQFIPAIELVPGDLLILSEGDHIPADARIIEAYGLRTSNATLLGESLPARKVADASWEEGISELERPNLVFAGTSVVSGTGKAVVYVIGMVTQFGRVASITQTIKDVPGLLHQDLKNFTQKMLIIALTLGILAFVIGIYNIGLSISQAFILALGVIVAFVPEGLQANVTFSLAMAGQRLAKCGVLVKKLSVIENLASLSVICTDKSGTLTQNQMTVREIWAGGKQLQVSGTGFAPSGEFSPKADLAKVQKELSFLLISATLCNNSRLIPPSAVKPTWSSLGDQTEVALKVTALKRKLNEAELIAQFPRVHELPFDPSRKRMSTIHQVAYLEAKFIKAKKPEGSAIPAITSGEVAFTKGAPREVLALCSKIYFNGEIRPLNEELRQQVLAAQDAFARQALRVLAFGYREIPERPDLYTSDTVEKDLTFLGLIAMHDPPRPELAEAVKIFKQVGIRLIMITGDYGLTAEALARKVGILETPTPRIVNGAELESMSDDDLKPLLKQEVIYARMAPEHKMRLVRAFQQSGEVVAVTGDGVNDAPALRKADIGIATGITGTDVAREAADIILTDDNLGNLGIAIEEGRAIYDNTRKFMTYFFSSNTPELLPFFMTALFNIPLALSVKQILSIDLIIDMLPGLALGAEKPEPDVLQHPPYARNHSFINRGLILRSYFWLGLLETLLAYSGYFLVYTLANGNLNFLGAHLPFLQKLILNIQSNPANVPLLASTMFFAGVVMAQFGNMFACRTENHRTRTVGWLSNPLLFVAGGGALLILLGMIYLPPVAAIFNHVPLPGLLWIWLLPYPFLIYGLDWIRKQILTSRSTRKNAIDVGYRHTVTSIKL